MLIEKELIGRYGEIRTLDPCHPMTVRYQAAPHTDFDSNSTCIYKKINKLLFVWMFIAQACDFKRLRRVFYTALVFI